MTKDIVISSLLNALKARGYPKGVIVHSDRGSQYASNEYKRVLKQYGLLGSMSKKVIVRIISQLPRPKLSQSHHSKLTDVPR